MRRQLDISERISGRLEENISGGGVLFYTYKDFYTVGSNPGLRHEVAELGSINLEGEVELIMTDGPRSSLEIDSTLQTNLSLLGIARRSGLLWRRRYAKCDPLEVQPGDTLVFEDETGETFRTQTPLEEVTKLRPNGIVSTGIAA